MPKQPKFIAITAGQFSLWALDEEGNVYRYVKEKKGKHFSFWSKLTSHRAAKELKKEDE